MFCRVRVRFRLIFLLAAWLNVEYVVISGIIFRVSRCLVVKKVFRICLRKDLEYPLGFNALKRVLVASSKSVFCVQILLNLSNCDLIRPGSGLVTLSQDIRVNNSVPGH